MHWSAIRFLYLAYGLVKRQKSAYKDKILLFQQHQADPTTQQLNTILTGSCSSQLTDLYFHVVERTAAVSQSLAKKKKKHLSKMMR